MMKRYGLLSVWVIATAFAFTTLYFSEIFLAPLCSLIWIERICLFPLVIIAGMASWHGFLGIASYLLPQTLIGFGFSTYHFLLLQGFSIAPPLPGCTEQIEKPLFWIPFASWIAFLLVNGLLIGICRISKRGVHERQ